MENLQNVGSYSETNVDNQLHAANTVDEDCQVLAEEPKRKRQRKGKAPQVQVKAETEDRNRNWLDSEVESLIALKGEMQPEFIKNAKKQAVDMWLKLHCRLMCLHPDFKKTPKACKSKFNDVYKAYKEDKLSNNTSGESRHTCKFYDSMDAWYHQNGSVSKHISASSHDLSAEDAHLEEVKANSSEGTPSTPKLKKSSGKLKFQESALELMGQMVLNSKSMAETMKEANNMMSNLDKQMDKLIDKL